MQDNPKFTDGISGLDDPIVENLCVAGVDTTYQRYLYISDNIDAESVEKEHTSPVGDPLGSDTREGFTKGSISLQLNLATDHRPRPGHILRTDFGDGYEYYISGKSGRARTLNDVVKLSVGVKKAVNPIITTLLSESYGQGYVHTQAAGALSGSVLTSAAVNTRGGATLAWSIAAAKGYSIPGWLSINSSSGVISGTAVAGTFEVKIVLTDTLSGFSTRKGFGIFRMVISA